MAQARPGDSGGAGDTGGASATIGRAVLLAAALLAVSLLPGGCSLFGEDAPPAPCPVILQPGETAQLTRFDGAGRDLTDVVFRARLLPVRSLCEYEDDDTLIESGLLVPFEVERGPALRRLQQGDGTVSFTYFVAVATNEAEPRILTREAFDVQAVFEGNRSRIAVADELAPRIPLGPGEDGTDYRIYVGIELNRAELDYNRQYR